MPMLVTGARSLRHSAALREGVAPLFKYGRKSPAKSTNTMKCAGRKSLAWHRRQVAKLIE
jgi:hypothetical protein